MLGRYIDALPCYARARVCAATAWCTRGYVDARGARCLLGHAEDWADTSPAAAHYCRDTTSTAARRAAGDDLLNWPPLIGERFDHVAARIGLDATVLLLQARARRPQWTSAPALRPALDVMQTTF